MIDSIQFYSENETTNHLFLKYPFAQHIWFLLGLSQEHFKNWSNIQDIVDFSCTLDKHDQLGFLIVFIAACWIVEI